MSKWAWRIWAGLCWTTGFTSPWVVIIAVSLFTVNFVGVILTGVVSLLYTWPVILACCSYRPSAPATIIINFLVFFSLPFDQWQLYWLLVLNYSWPFFLALIKKMLHGNSHLLPLLWVDRTCVPFIWVVFPIIPRWRSHYNRATTYAIKYMAQTTTGLLKTFSCFKKCVWN